MAKTIVFIHGMFQNAKSWEKWIAYFTGKGYTCIAPNWPLHEGEPKQLRANPPEGLGDLGLETVTQKMQDIIMTLSEKPIVIGHSVGGLIVQLLSKKNMIQLGVPISAVAPNDMLAFDWEFFKNSVKIANPLKGDEPVYQTYESFYDAFCNTLTPEAAQQAFEDTATHDSRNVLRDCLLGPGRTNFELPHRPLLFIAGDKDHIIPHELVEKNSKAYKDEQSEVDFKLFEQRSHYICGEPGWEEVAEYVFNWIAQKDKDTV